MATRNILSINKLSKFEDFLERKGYMILGTSRNPYEALRAKKAAILLLYIRKRKQKNICQ